MSYHLTHPDSDLTIECDADQVPMYTSQGWQTKPGAKPPEAPATGPIITTLAAEPVDHERQRQ